MPKIVDHAARRTEIVHALWLVIYTRGIDAVTFRAVADAAGISIGRVQHYFPSREALVLEGCRQLVAGAEIDDEAELVDEAGDGSGEMEEAGDVAGADPVDALRTFVRAFIPAGEAMRVGASVWFTYVAKAVGDPLIAEIVVDNDRRTAEAAARRGALSRPPRRRCGSWRSRRVWLRTSCSRCGPRRRPTASSIARSPASQPPRRRTELTSGAVRQLSQR